MSRLEDYADEILALVAELPDWTLDELIVAMHRRRVPGSRSALWRFLVSSFVPRLSAEECANYFAHPGYASI